MGELAAAPGWADVSARVTAYAPATRRIALPAQGVKLVLAPAAEVEGKVLLADSDQPVAGALVELMSIGDTARTTAAAISDDAGAFRMAHLPPGSFSLMARTATQSSEESQLRLGTGEAAQASPLRLLPAASLHGTVSVGSVPCSRGGRVVAYGQRVREATTDPDGAIALDGLLPGGYVITISCDGGLPLGDRLQLDMASVTRHWELLPSSTLRGVVQQRNGAPLPGAKVGLVPAAFVTAGIRAVDDSSCGLTDASGAFVCAGLTPGDYDCNIAGEWPAATEPVRVSVGPELDAHVTLTARSMGTIVARLPSTPRIDVSHLPVFAQAAGTDSVESGVPLGNAVEFRNLPLGSYEVYAGPRPRQRGSYVRVALQQDEQRVEIELPPLQSTAVSGRASRRFWRVANLATDAVPASGGTAQPTPGGRGCAAYR